MTRVLQPSPALSLLVVALSCCGEPEPLPYQGQLLVYVDTDAPVPLPPGQAAAVDAPAPLFDRLRIEVLAPDDDEPCTGCRREIAVDSAMFGARQVSFGLRAKQRSVLRVRLYPSRFVSLGEPHPNTTIELTVALPEPPAEGITELGVFLSTETVGRPRGSPAEPEQPTPGAPAASLVGTWPGARRVSCSEPPPEGQACVPGGVFWMGSASFFQGALRPRLVVLSPFYLDQTEITVGAMRDWLGGGKPETGLFGIEQSAYCRYDLSGDHDAFALNCMSRSLGEEYCDAHGGVLPTEAQLEYAAGGLRSTPYTWGSEVPACGDAVFGRGPYQEYQAHHCLASGELAGPLEPGSGARDRLVLDGREVVDLNGNLTEYTRDAWQDDSGSCWAEIGVHYDPFCAPGGLWWDEVNKGGYFGGSAWQLVAHYRRAGEGFGASLATELGIRCAYPDLPGDP